MRNMKTCDEIRRENLLALIKEAGGESHLAEKYGCTDAAIKTWAKAYKDSKTGIPKEIGRVPARKFEEIMGKERGWLDHDHSSQSVNLSAIEREVLAAMKKMNDRGLHELALLASQTVERNPRQKFA